MPIQFEDRENYSQMLFSLADSFSRVLSSALGLGQHHRYYRPLWDPQRCIKRKTVNEGTQLIGFEYFGINRHIPNFVDVSSVAFLIEIELSNESDEWFLDSTNLEGESLVALSYNARAYSLIVNDAVVSYEDFPLLYDSLRRREYFWKFYETNNVSHQDIIDFLPKFQSLKPLQSTLTSLCYELGLIRYGKLTASGESLIGQYRRKLKYEFTKSQ